MAVVRKSNKMILGIIIAFVIVHQAHLGLNVRKMNVPHYSAFTEAIASSSTDDPKSVTVPSTTLDFSVINRYQAASQRIHVPKSSVITEAYARLSNQSNCNIMPNVFVLSTEPGSPAKGPTCASIGA